MSNISPKLAEQAALQAANAASESLMTNFGHAGSGKRASVDAWMKSPGALLTEADLAADKAISDALTSSGVDAALLSEESRTGDVSGDASWLVDPLCGTVPFRSGLPHWGLSIALRTGDELSVGVLAVPPRDMTLSTATGHGVSLNGEPFQCEDPGLPFGEAVVGLEIDSGDWKRMLSAAPDGSRGIDWVTQVDNVATLISAAYPISLVCTGGMSGVVFYKVDSVHVAAGAAIAEELGIRVTDENGNRLDWRSQEPYPVVVFAWPSIHAELLAAMRHS